MYGHTVGRKLNHANTKLSACNLFHINVFFEPYGKYVPCFFTKRVVHAGEELLWDYGTDNSVDFLRDPDYVPPPTEHDPTVVVPRLTRSQLAKLRAPLMVLEGKD